jgi:hypothetical protein
MIHGDTPTANQAVERMAAGECYLQSRALWSAATVHFCVRQMCIKSTKTKFRWRVVGLGVLFGVICIVLCFHFPVEYKWVLGVGCLLVSVYRIYAYSRCTRTLHDLEKQMKDLERDDL